MLLSSCGCLLSWHGASSGCVQRRRPPGVRVSCGCITKDVSNSPQRTVVKPGAERGSNNCSAIAKWGEKRWLKRQFYEELEHIFRKFPKYHMKILLGDFNSKVGWENIFKPTIENESLHQYSNDNCVWIVNFAHKKIYLLRARCSRTETLIAHLDLSWW